MNAHEQGRHGEQRLRVGGAASQRQRPAFPSFASATRGLKATGRIDPHSALRSTNPGIFRASAAVPTATGERESSCYGRWAALTSVAVSSAAARFLQSANGSGGTPPGSQPPGDTGQGFSSPNTSLLSQTSGRHARAADVPRLAGHDPCAARRVHAVREQDSRPRRVSAHDAATISTRKAPETVDAGVPAREGQDSPWDCVHGEGW